MIDGVELSDGLQDKLVHWVVYDTRTGEILRAGLGPARTMKLQACGECEAVLPGRGCDHTHRVVDGNLVLVEVER